MKTYAERAKETFGEIDQPQTLRPCGWCGEATKHDTLATLGARCARCYHVFCNTPAGPAADVGDKRSGGLRDWAFALKQREEAGERISSVKRAMWRAALGECSA